MKKTNKLISILLVVAMLLSMAPITVFAAESLTDTTTSVTLADADGDGAYEIGTAEELEAFTNLVNSGNNAIAAELIADINYNPGYGFTFDYDTGLVVISKDDNAVAYIGTNVLGDESGSNTFFDTTASVAGTVYSDAAGTTGVLPEDLKIWKPIGKYNDNYDGNGVEYPYIGTFDGAGYAVSGLISLYGINDLVDYAGLFGYVSYSDNSTTDDTTDDIYGTIKNVEVTNSFFYANRYTGGICGYLYKGAIIENCCNSGIVIATRAVGGITGTMSDNAKIVGSHNSGLVCAAKYEDVAGIVGRTYENSLVENCYNAGRVISASTSRNAFVGGIVGYNYIGIIRNCYNTGSVSAIKMRVGGICGYHYDGTIENSHSVGTLSGEDYVGGIVGYYNTGTFSNCYYLSGTAEGGVDGADKVGSAEVKTAEEFADGTVYELLQNANTEQVWGQIIDTDNYPVFYNGSNKPVPPHTHSWTYTASGNRIVATCIAGDCTLENGVGGTLTISAPAKLYTDGTIAREADIDNQLVDTSVVIGDIIYSTADGSAPTTAGTYTASITLGDATASIEYTVISVSESGAYELSYTGPCDTANTHTVDFYPFLPEDVVITSISIGTSSILSSATPGWTTNEATFKFVTKVLAEPASDTISVTVSTENHGTFTFNIEITLTGKYIVNISGVKYNDGAYATGVTHSGYRGTPVGTLTSGAAYNGTFVYSYKDADGNILTSAPTEAGKYTVTIAVPEDNENYYGSTTFEFEVFAQPQARWQTEENGEWISGSFTQALTDVYSGGTIKLLDNVYLASTETLNKDITITSNDAEKPCTISTNVDKHGYILSVTSNVTLENVIVDGGSANNLTATRALVAVNGGKLTLNSGTIIKNNKNTTNQGIGGGVCVISGELVLDGGTVTGNNAYFGGGVGMVGGIFNMTSGTITANSASIGGGVCVWHSGDVSSTMNITGGSVTQNNAKYYAGGIDCYMTSSVNVSGNPVISGNTSGEETDGGIYPDGNKTEGIAVIKAGKLTDGADISFYSWLGEEGLIIAQPADGYTLTSDDLSKMGYNSDDLTLKISEDGKVMVISVITAEIERIAKAVASYDEETVKSSDEETIEQIKDDIQTLINSGDLTDGQLETLDTVKADADTLIDKIAATQAEIERIEGAVNGYDVVTVKSTDKADLEQLIADIKALTDGQNITDEERTNLENLGATVDALLAKIAETKTEYDRVIAAANGYDEATVTSADKDALVQLNEDIYALALTDNVTADELENLENAHDKVLGLIDKLTGISDEIKRIVEAVDKYVFESVKSSDKADIQQLIADIKALTDTQNITADEKTLLEGADETCDKLVAKIDETVAEINRINDATNAYDEATVTSADKADIEKLIADIKALTDGDNITAEERKQLEGNETTLNALLDKIGATADEIARIENVVNSYDEATVKSTDKADLEQLKEDIKALTDGDNINDDERAKLAELDKKIDALIKKIDDTAAEIERIDEAVNGYDEETVKSSDEEAINQLKEDIQTLIDSGNVTEEEIKALEETKADTDALTDKIDETQAEIDRINDAVDSYTEDTVKSTDEEAINQLKEDIQALIDSGNVTEEEIAALEDTKADADALTDKITETEDQLEEIGNIENGYDPETVTSDDKAAIEEAIAEIEAVNPDNLTDEQKAEYDEIKAGFEALLNEIAAAEKSVADIGAQLEMFDENRVTIFWEDDIEALKAKIDELLADENMGEAEKAKLNEYKAQAEKLIEIINTPKEYFSLRFFYFIWDCLTWKYNGILWLFSNLFGC